MGRCCVGRGIKNVMLRIVACLFSLIDYFFRPLTEEAKLQVHMFGFHADALEIVVH